MTGKVVPFEAWHVHELILQNGDEGQSFINRPIAEAIAQNGDAHTLIDGTKIVCCAGVLRMWPGRAQAWFHFADDAGPYMVQVTREVRKRLNDLQGRIEMTVVADFEAGHRWAKMLGFQVETPLMKQYGPWGEDHVGYVRIN